MKLFDYFRSSASYRVRIALNLKNIPFDKSEVHLVNNGGEQHHDEYVKLNPQELIPTLDDNGIILNQSMAILEYLEEKYPQNSLFPNDLVEKAKARMIANIVACDIHPLNNLRVLNYLTQELNHDESVKNSWIKNWIGTGFKAIESLLNKYQTNADFCIGDSVSIADICLIPQVYNAHRFECDMDAFPRINQVNEACLKLKCFDEAKP